MDFIYDILINLNKELYDFFEWNESDQIDHVRKIPVFKLSAEDFKNIKYSSMKVDISLLTKIRNKTEVFGEKHKIEKKDCCALFTDGADLVVIEFDKSGHSLFKSVLLPEEASDILDECETIKEIPLNYKVLKTPEQILNTRFETEVLEYINKEFEGLVRIKHIEKLKYLYFEWYGKLVDDNNALIGGLQKIYKTNFNDKHVGFYELLKLSNAEKI